MDDLVRSKGDQSDDKHDDQDHPTTGMEGALFFAIGLLGGAHCIGNVRAARDDVLGVGITSNRRRIHRVLGVALVVLGFVPTVYAGQHIAAAAIPGG